MPSSQISLDCHERALGSVSPSETPVAEAAKSQAKWQAWLKHHHETKPYGLSPTLGRERCAVRNLVAHRVILRRDGSAGELVWARIRVEEVSLNPPCCTFAIVDSYFCVDDQVMARHGIAYIVHTHARVRHILDHIALNEDVG